MQALSELPVTYSSRLVGKWRITYYLGFPQTFRKTKLTNYEPRTFYLTWFWNTKFFRSSKSVITYRCFMQHSWFIFIILLSKDSKICPIFKMCIVSGVKSKFLQKYEIFKFVCWKFCVWLWKKKKKLLK